MLRNFLKKNDALPFRTAIFLSGTGSNAAHILALHRQKTAPAWTPAVIVTDRNDSAAPRLAEEYGLPLILLDIREFYHAHGLKTTSMRSEQGLAVRKLWTDELRKQLAPFKIDFAIFAGFVPLCNIVEDFPCLNVHPGDLTTTENGKRVLVGLHTIPVEEALLRHLPSLRSSVIVVQPVSAGAKEMDSGALLGVSAPMPVVWDETLEQTVAVCKANRQGKLRSEYKGDDLNTVASKYQHKLKKNGDWIVFPPVIDDFAAGFYAFDDENGTLYYRGEPVTTVEFSPDGSRKVIQ